MKNQIENKIQNIVYDYKNLRKLACEFLKDTRKHGSWYTEDIRFMDAKDDTIGIYHWQNTACDCHPYFEWQPIATYNEFISWVNKKENIDKLFN